MTHLVVLVVDVGSSFISTLKLPPPPIHCVSGRRVVDGLSEGG